MLKKSLIGTLIIFVILAVGIVAVNAEIIKSGTFTDDDYFFGTEGNVWTIDSDGVLEITGTGFVSGEKFMDYGEWVYSSYWAGGSIKKIVISEGITTIGTAAFSNFKAESITLPSTIRYIDEGAFYNCSALKEIIYNGTEEQWENVTVIPSENKSFLDAALNSSLAIYGAHTNSIDWKFDSDGVLWIWGEGTIKCLEVKIGKYYSEKYFWWHDLDVKEVVIGEGITGIGEYAFKSVKLNKLTLPKSLKTIGKNACIETDSVVYNGTYEDWKKVVIDYGNRSFVSTMLEVFPTVHGINGQNATWSLDRNGTLVISGKGRVDAIEELAEEWSGYEYYEHYPVWSGLDINSIIVMEGITEFNYKSFAFYENKECVVLPSSLKVIGDENVVYTHIYYLGDKASWDNIENVTAEWDDCYSEENVTFINSCLMLDANGGNCSESIILVRDGEVPVIPVPEREGYTFLGWSDSAEDGTIIENPAALSGIVKLYANWEERKLGSGNFGDNLTWQLTASGLLSVEGNGSMGTFTSVTKVPWGALFGDIKKVEISEGVTDIGNYAFSYCTKLNEVSIPESVKNIGEAAFYLTSLEKVVYGGSPVMWRDINVGADNSELDNAVVEYLACDYEVTYACNSNGAVSVTKTSDSVPEGWKADLSVTATRACVPCEPVGLEKDVPWKFLGWNTDENATEALDELIVTSDVTLYPIFKKELTFNFYHGNRELLESKTVVIYNSADYAEVDVPAFSAYKNWEPVEWCSNKYYDGDKLNARMYEMGKKASFCFSVDLYACYEKTVSVSYEEGDVAYPIEDEHFVLDYYASGFLKEKTILLPDIKPFDDKAKCRWALGSAEGEIFECGDMVIIRDDTVFYALSDAKKMYETSTEVDKANKTVTVNIDKRGDEEGCIIVAVYDDKGAVVQYKTENIKNLVDSYTIPLGDSLSKADMIKIFVWRSEASMEPLSVAEHINCQEQSVTL